MDKTNIVNVNRVYEETLKKEATAYRLREDFTLNPKKMNTIPPKPNYVIKGEMPLATQHMLGLVVKHQDPSVKEHLDAALAQTRKVPTEKYDQPMTTQQEIGWMATSHANHFKHRKYHGISGSGITKFAETYAVCMGMNPFQRKKGQGGGGAGE